MVGSSQSISMANTIINTIVASELDQFADILEKSGDINSDVKNIIIDTLEKHERIIFNGNNYSEEWVKEAERRGLLNLKSTPECIRYFASEKNVSLFEKYGIFTRNEINSRVGILYDNYCNILHIEALTMIDMCNKNIIPSVIEFQGKVASAALSKKKFSDSLSVKTEDELLKKISKLLDCLSDGVRELEDEMVKVNGIGESDRKAAFYRESIFTCMSQIREIADELELIVDEKDWPFPAYGAVLYSVR
jgi:glutamine synthetase